MAPSEYPRPHTTIAAIISRSPVAEAPCDRERANPATDRLPKMEHIQNADFGRSPARNTPKIAVANGNRPMKTIERAEVMCWSAIAVRSGNPMTQPSATKIRDPISLRAGRSREKNRSNIAAKDAAIPARAEVRNKGVNPPTATRVAGNDPLKITIPTSPFIQPCVVVFMIESYAAIRFEARYNSVQLSKTVLQHSPVQLCPKK